VERKNRRTKPVAYGKNNCSSNVATAAANRRHARNPRGCAKMNFADMEGQKARAAARESERI